MTMVRTRGILKSHHEEICSSACQHFSYFVSLVDPGEGDEPAVGHHHQPHARCYTEVVHHEHHHTGQVLPLPMPHPGYLGSQGHSVHVLGLYNGSVSYTMHVSTMWNLKVNNSVIINI